MKLLYYITFTWTKPRKREFSSTDELKIFPKFGIEQYWLSNHSSSVFIECPELDIEQFEKAVGIYIDKIQVVEPVVGIKSSSSFWPSLQHFLSFLLALFIFPITALVSRR